MSIPMAVGLLAGLIMILLMVRDLRKVGEEEDVKPITYHADCFECSKFIGIYEYGEPQPAYCDECISRFEGRDRAVILSKRRKNAYPAVQTMLSKARERSGRF